MSGLHSVLLWWVVRGGSRQGACQLTVVYLDKYLLLMVEIKANHHRVTAPRQTR
jgi:hypothetical protein